MFQEIILSFARGRVGPFDKSRSFITEDPFVDEFVRSNGVKLHSWTQAVHDAGMVKHNRCEPGPPGSAGCDRDWGFGLWGSVWVLAIGSF